MRKLPITSLVFTLILAYALAAPAQTLPTAKDFVGEKLDYEAKFSKIIQGMAVADVSFSFEKRDNSDNFMVRATATSKGSLIKLFRFSFLQQFETTIDGLTFNVLATKKHDVQRDRIRDSIADFDYKEKRVIFVENDPNNPTRPPRRIASEISDPLNDIVSGIYRVRMMPLSVGKSLRIDVSDTGIIYGVPIRVTAREQQKTIFGKVWCYRLEPDVFGLGRLIEQNGKMVIWLVDDDRRTPVRTTLSTNYGKFDIRLKTATRP